MVRMRVLASSIAGLAFLFVTNALAETCPERTKLDNAEVKRLITMIKDDSADQFEQILAVESNLSRAGTDVVLRTVDYDLAKKSLALRSGERELSGVLNVSHRRFSLSPDGALVAYLGFETNRDKAGKEQNQICRGSQTPPDSMVFVSFSRFDGLFSTRF